MSVSELAPKRQVATAVVAEPLELLFIQTEEAANLARAKKLDGTGIDPYPAWVTRMFDLKTTGYAPDRLKVANVADGDAFPSMRDLNRFDGIFVGGSGHQTTENVPLVHQTREFMRTAAAAGHEMLVVCFGHQTAHEAHNGTTADADQLQFGIGRTTLTDAGAADPINTGLPRTYSVFESNSRLVDTMAPSTAALHVVELSQGRTRHHATRIGPNLRTSQWHPDLDPDVMEALAVGKQNAGVLRVSREELPDVVADIQRNAQEALNNGRKYARNWLDHVVIPRRATLLRS